MYNKQIFSLLLAVCSLTVVKQQSPVSIKWDFNGNGQYTPATVAAVYPLSGRSPMGMLGRSSITVTPAMLSNKLYKGALTGMGGNNVCDSIIPGNPKLVPICECGQWNNVTVNQKEYNCGDKIPWVCNTPATFNVSYQCTSVSQPCMAAISWVLKNDHTNAIIKTGNGVNNVTENFTPTSNGSYTISFTPKCGTKRCRPYCAITLVVNNCVNCRCDQFYFTGAVAPNNNGFTATGSIDISGLPPIYGIEMQVQSYSYSANPAACTNGVSSIERSGVFLQQGTTINGLPVALLNETVSGLTTTNNGISKNIKMLSNSPLPLNVPVNLNLGLPAPIVGLPHGCCRITYQFCIKVKVFYDKLSCKSCVLTYCFPAFTN